jgi:hypothetical protein
MTVSSPNVIEIKLDRLIDDVSCARIRSTQGQAEAILSLIHASSALGDLPAEVKKSFDAILEAGAAFKADLEKLLKNEGHMPEDKFLVMSRKGKRLGVAFAGALREGGASLKFKTK